MVYTKKNPKSSLEKLLGKIIVFLYCDGDAIAVKLHRHHEIVSVLWPMYTRKMSGLGLADATL